MKRKLLIILSAIFLFTTNGCSDYLDINHDPNALPEIKGVKALLPATQMGIANNLMGWDFGFGGAFWTEYWTQSYTASQFKALCEYLPQDFNTTYQSLLSQPLPDLNYIRENSKGDADKGYYFIAEALSIFTWQMVTDVWGDMPYSESMMGDKNMHPKQDKQEEIYADLLKRVDQLLATDLTGVSIDGKFDYIYEGDLIQWYKFANSLKLKLMLRLSETPQYDNAKVLSFIQSAKLLTTSARISGKIWEDQKPGKRHPMREFEAQAKYLNTNVIASKTFFDYLDLNGDPRLAKLFSGSRAAFFGDFDSKQDSDGNGTADDKEAYAKVVFAGDMDLMLMSAWEVNFYIAEVYARAGSAQAKDFYEAGVKASLAQHNILNEDNKVDVSIVETGYAKWTGGNTEAQIKQIAMQKWVANCNYQHIESFLERNRIKYPSVSEIDIAADRQLAWRNFPVGDLTISVKGKALLNANLPASPLYPSSYINRNNNAPSQKPNVGTKVWWNQKQGK